MHSYLWVSFLLMSQGTLRLSTRPTREISIKGTDSEIIFNFRATKELLPATYVTRERGKITVKGKGEMVTFWLDSKSGRAPPSKDEVISL